MFDTLIIAIMRHPRVSAVAGVVVCVLGGSFLWWRVVWQQPQRVFIDMLANNLQTVSVTKVASASGSGQSVVQDARLQMGSTNAADWLVSATQAGSSVTTESIATPAAGYIRYTSIAATSQSTGSKLYDFHKVLNVWGKSDGKTDASLDHLFSQTLLDISNAPLPPIANLPEAERQNILTYMQAEKIFAPSYTSVKRQKVNGRDAYTYTVAVQLGAYIRMMQAFAHDLGLTDLDTVDPSQYSTVPPISITVSVDRASHQLVRITYPGSGFSQSYQDWGLLPGIAIPTHTITATQLQAQVQALGPATT